MSGLSPEDLFDEAVANMICDGVEDLRNGCAKIYYEQDEAKKVNSKCCKVLFCSSHETNYSMCVCVFFSSILLHLSSLVPFAQLFLFSVLSKVHYVTSFQRCFLLVICACMV